ncbi:hypothetical protein O7606_27355 [Micromonospora sp. WMMD882]|uniref:hypothetical protein n=1 Tax=Micromonospora sp. WMMD882 TaxID=3015151 RepID=UPI00248CDD36|nr:hypothetical protein [Micromonospora sp. WMMD882]WBB79799.1 hypothetical protein O7606_27355 [Micromonospora sp. WMMD882]
MVRRVSRLLGAAIGVMLVVLAPVSVAAAAPKPPPPGVDITGEGLTEPLRLRVETDAAHVTAVIDQVSWFAATGEASGPKAADLGPKYTVVVLAGDKAKQTFDLYPLAKGGPRAFRPAKQPDGRKARDGWFLGRLNMSETLRTAGVPLPRQVETVSGGVGGGERMIPEESLDPGRDLDEALGELQRLLLLNAGVVVTITIGLAGIALLIRRRTR